MAARKSVRVGTARSKPGAWTTGTLRLGDYPDGPITTPVNILSGSEPGPVLWVQCAIHGGEIVGAIALLHLFKKIRTARMRGHIVGIMATNATAFRAQQRLTPYDGENLNRLFPGMPTGPHSRQTADVLFRTATGVADAMMDIHSGGIEAVVPFYGLYFDDDSAASQEARRLAESVGSDVVWASRDAWLDGAMFVNFTRAGKPGVIVECGGGGWLTEEHVANVTGAIEGVAKAMGILPGKPPRRKSYTVVRDCDLVFNTKGGYFLPAFDAGAIVKKNAVIGRIMDAHGEIVEEIRSPIGPAYLAALGKPYAPVHSGAMVAECIGVE